MLAQNCSRELSIPSDLSAARCLQADIEAMLSEFGYSDHDIFSVKMAMEEALVNAIKHGNKLDPQKKVHVRYSIAPDRFDINIRDEGLGFCPEAVPDPTAPENLERPCGRGLLLMRHYMCEVNYADSGRAVCMCKLRNSRQ